MNEGILGSGHSLANGIILAVRGSRPARLLPSAILATDDSKLAVAVRVNRPIKDLCSYTGILDRNSNGNSERKTLLCGGMFQMVRCFGIEYVQVFQKTKGTA